MMATPEKAADGGFPGFCENLIANVAGAATPAAGTVYGEPLKSLAPNLAPNLGQKRRNTRIIAISGLSMKNP